MANFADAHLKIERANHHIARLNSRIEALEQSDVATVAVNPKFGNEVIKHDLRDIEGKSVIALIAGMLSTISSVLSIMHGSKPLPNSLRAPLRISGNSLSILLAMHLRERFAGTE